MSLRDLFLGRSPRSILQISIPPNLCVLVLAPHPDDFDSIGVTLRYLLNNGNSINLGVARTGSGVQDSFHPGANLEDKTILRENEQRNSIRFFGLSSSNLTFFEMENDITDQLVINSANKTVLDKFIKIIRPDIIFLPHGNDTNSAHRAMYVMFREIASQFNNPIAACLNRDPKTLDIQITLYTPFGKEQAEWKCELLRYHDTQHKRNINTRGLGLDERILEVNRQIARDLDIDTEYAEGFEIEFYP